MKREHALGAALALTLVLGVSSARAEERQRAAAAPAESYGYVFPDDPLAAGDFGPNDVHIRVVQHAMRTTLIRLRTNFVAEMLVSVEKL